ncbi:MAG: 50S ribosomal protein L9 [Candidatus Zambryskibacteria bacterium CG10_big_fil_rev_8_21_14_0_10_42_12]|uniref:Large ribosomal subunit protein bL9 n=1 Tax=Candidatus Zambryskibacteria bacterium CG10_big_fil_rev_8_21_14_0_10_42_12 TaxID=1975115 RepID=A0A2H0QVG1_9BACT|nr:MAG: 50S ribosomal protein L9 [Candidatus Zambryskibacteria bacterium CG10_big_fil_rev_8_21_14_0_10_42_12]
MKVILLKDVQKVGRAYDVKEVAPGFAMNQLIPQKLAERATPAALKALEAKKSEIEAKRAAHTEALLAQIDKIEGVRATIEAKANDKGHLFAGVDAGAVAKAISEATGMEISERLISLKEPIKEIGDHNITVSLGEKEAKAVLEIKAK